ncbi:type I polyketide synthase [Amycolatopsis anabasis]|uniref:type I polyketide synthase n=1 Tax=Amycolatopsis anabasis TaxID=1840409 RepID=UPI00131C946F|nr:type I polyketide synthase [Amycolatopsis anabasis]
MRPEELRRWLVEQIATTCGLAPSDVDTARPLREYGLTSREAVLLGGELEDLLDRELPTALVWHHPTIDALVTALLGESAEPERATRVPERVTHLPECATRVPESETREPIAVIGLGCRLPGGVRGPDDFWRLLIGGESGVSEVPEGRWEQFGHDSPDQAERLGRLRRWGGFLDDIARFDAEFFGITPREAAAMDPQQRLLLEVAWEALEHAGVASETLRGSRTGVFVGISGNEYSHLTLDDVTRIDAWSGTGSALSIAANRLSYVFDLRGPSVAVDSACSSSLTAVHLAVQSLRGGESEVALAAGANLLLGPGIMVNFDEMGVISQDGRCKAFDAAADGIARAEGAGVVVLKPLSAAVRDGDRVLAVLRGSAVNSDGRSNGLTAPNPEAQQALLRTAYQSAGVDPAEVDYVEAHGTGTLLGDPIEATALGKVLGNDRNGQPLLIGSVKSNLGHLEAAAGITGLIKVVLALANRRIPASLHFTEPNPHIPFDELRLAVAAEQQPWPGHGRPARAGVSGFGFGGTNAHVVVEQAPAAEPVEEREPGHGLFLLADASPERIRRRATVLADWLSGPGEHSALSDVEHTLARRASGRHRAVIAAGTRDDLVSGLRALAAGTTRPEVVTGVRDRIGAGPVWVFSGQGSQWTGMCRGLLAAEPAFADAVAEVDAALRPEIGWSLREILDGGVEPAAFADLQPYLFGVQVALAKLWLHHGVTPAAVIGHSLGEVAAAVIGGAVSLADGAKIAVRRSRLLAETAGRGAMAVLELSAEDVTALLRDYPDVDIAVLNAPVQTVVAGQHEQVRALAAAVEARGLLARLIKSEVAGHSRLVENAANALRGELSDVDAQASGIPMYLGAAEDPRAEVVLGPDYWVRNVRRTVRFADAVTAALEDGFTTFLEISPHPVLFHAVTETAATTGAEVHVLGTLRRDEDEPRRFHANRGRLVALSGAPHATAGRLLDLPTTPWQGQAHWTRPAARRTAPGTHPLLGTHSEVPGQGTHVWLAELGTLAQPWLAEHRIDDRPILAGACYVEMALIAASTALGREPHRLALRDLSLHQPLPLAEQTPVTTTFTPEGDGGRVDVHTKGADGTWTLHCTVAVAEAEEAESSWRPGDGDPGRSLPPSRLYERLRSLGVGYGPAFTGLTEIRATDAAAVAAVSVPEEAPRGGYLLHPVLLDCCLQSFAATLSDDSGDGAFYMPVEFGSVRLFGDPGEGVTGHVSLRQNDSDRGGLFGELRLTDPDGRVLLEITEIFVRRMVRGELATPLRERLLERVWRQEDPPPAQEAAETLVIAPAGHPLADRIAAGLGARVLPGADLDVIRATLISDRPSAVAFLVAEADEPSGLAAGQRALLDTVDLVRALVDLPGVPPRLWLVTSSAATVLPGDPGRPGQAALRGLIRVLSYEHPALRASWLDVEASDVDRAAAEVVGELAAAPADDEVAWRDGRRFTGRLAYTTAPAPETERVVRSDGGYVITGGLTGLGLLVAGWLADRGAAKIVLNGRSAPKPAAQAVIEELRAGGTAIEVVLGDIAEPGVAPKLLAEAARDAVPRGVVHAAAVFDDRTVSRLDDETVRRTWRPKAVGAWRLHEATAELELDWWLGFSSATALHGLPGQPAYASANAYLDAVVALRRASGLPAAAVNWGTWAEVGAAAGLEVPWLRPISPDEGLGLLGDVLASGGGALGAVRLDIPRLLDAFADLADVPFFADLFAGYARADDGAGDWPGLAAVRGREPAEIRALASAQLRARVASVTGFSADSLPDDTALTSLGVDSLLAVRIRNALQHDFEVALPVSLLLRGGSLAELERWLFSELAVTSEVPRQRRSAQELVRPRDAAERLVVAAWEEVLGVPVGVTSEFAALGGDEVQAELVTSLLSGRSGHALRTAELFAQPTPELMAQVIREADRAQAGPVRVLRESGQARPLFFFHPGGGDTAVFRQLVDLLDPDVPAYGFDRTDTSATVEERVRGWLPELRRHQPHGPYRLSGWSFGGFLAFEAAQQLTAAGEQVELLALVDPILPLPMPQEAGLSEVELLERRFERYAEFLKTSYGKAVELPYAEMARLDDEAQADLLADTILAAGVVDERVGEAILAHQRASFLDARLLERYRPDRYAGRTVFYSAASPVPGGLRDQRFDREDPARGWDEVCTDLELVTVPGHHLSLLDPPNVEVIADHLNRTLRTALSKPYAR